MSMIYEPVCGSTEVHRPHLHWDGPDKTVAWDCGGYSAEQRDVAALLALLDKTARLYALAGPEDRTLRLEVGPGALSAISRNVMPSFDDLLAPSRPVTEKLHMEAVVVTTLGSYGWRIVISSGEIGDGHGVV